MSEHKRSSGGGFQQTALLCAAALMMGGFLSAGGILLLGKIVENKGINLDDLVLPVTLIGILGAMFAGYLLKKTARINCLIGGGLSGGFFSIVFLAAALLNGIQEITWYAPIKCVSFLIGGAFGGALASVRVKRRKHGR